MATERLRISFSRKRRKKDDSSSSSSSESDASDDSSESNSSSSDDSTHHRKGKRKSNKRDGEKKKCAHSVPSLVVNSCDGSHDMAMDESTPSIVVDNSDDDGNDVSPAFQEYAQILVNQSTASQNLKLRAHDEKLDALWKEMDNQKRTVQELGDKFDKHTQGLPRRPHQSEDNVVSRLLAASGGSENTAGKDKGKGSPSPTSSRCRLTTLEVPATDEPHRSPRTRDHGLERSPRTCSKSAKPYNRIDD